MKINSLPTILAALAVVAFILTMIGSDVGASQTVVLRALCAVAVLGTASFTAFLRARDLV